MQSVTYSSTDLAAIEQAILAIATGERADPVTFSGFTTEYGDAEPPLCSDDFTAEHDPI